MSTEIKANLNDKSVVRFWGGDERGAMLQVTGGDGYVQFNLIETVEVVKVFSDFIAQEAKRRQELLKKKVKEMQELEKTVWEEIANLDKALCNIDLLAITIALIDKFAPRV